jgi:septum formation protein
VVLGEAVLGKPEDEAHARWMLEQLQDRRHEVITGICLLNRKQAVCRLEEVRTQVWMRRIEPEEMDAYIRTGEPFDKAGGYAIQGDGGGFVRKIQGSYSNVVGLPMERLGELFRMYGIS